MENSKDRFLLLRKILKAIGLPDEAISDIVERILDWLSTKDESSSSPTVFPFRRRDDFLSNAEVSFCRVLRSVVAERAVVCPKVNLGDLFFANTGDHRKNRAFANRIDRKHIDFLLCDPDTLQPLAGIELDDKSHQRSERQIRDELVENVFSAAGLPLVRFLVKSAYMPREVEAQIQQFLAGPKRPSADFPKPEPLTPRGSVSADPSPACPKCGSKMLLRTAKSGAHAGGQFWGCSNFPRCRSTLPIPSDREQIKKQT